jgi:hypothetical protein
MPRASSTPRHRVPLPASGFTAEEWRLVTKLPAEVMIATISIQDDGPRHGDAGAARTQRRTVAEGLAGLDAIAAGRGSDSDLVRAVVAAIYAEPEEDRPQEPAHRDDPQALRARVLADCRRVVEILRAGADPADGAAYHHWVRQVAVRVCAASRSGGVLGIAGDRIGSPEGTFGDAPEPDLGRFLDELGAALS